MSRLADDEMQAIMDAVALEVEDSRTPWDEIGDLTLAELCARNQNALADDYFDDDPDDDRERILHRIAVYDRLLGTNLIATLGDTK